MAAVMSDIASHHSSNDAGGLVFRMACPKLLIFNKLFSNSFEYGWIRNPRGVFFPNTNFKALLFILGLGSHATIIFKVRWAYTTNPL